jgi:hypothetical protein
VHHPELPVDLFPLTQQYIFLFGSIYLTLGFAGTTIGSPVGLSPIFFWAHDFSDQ